MPSIAKPVAVHPSLHKNELGLTIRDYEGSMSTLCAGCGHTKAEASTPMPWATGVARWPCWQRKVAR